MVINNGEVCEIPPGENQLTKSITLMIIVRKCHSQNYLFLCKFDFEVKIDIQLTASKYFNQRLLN